MTLTESEISHLAQPIRKRILEYVLNEKKVTPKDLGFSRFHIYKARHGLIPISDDLVKACIRFLTVDEYVRIVGEKPKVTEASPEEALKVIKTCIVDVKFREWFLKLLHQYLGNTLYQYSKSYIVNEEDLKMFEKLLTNKAKDTRERHLRYLLKALKDLDFELEPSKLQEYVQECLEKYGISVTTHMAKALKKFIKLVIKTKRPELYNTLYNSFTIPKPRSANPLKEVKVFNIDELRKVFRELPSLEVKIYFLLLAECGLRPGEPFLIKIQDIDFNNRVICFEVEGKSKRRYLTFMHEDTARFIKEAYLPYRNQFIKTYISSLRNLGYDNDVVKEWESKLIPFDRARLRNEIKETFRKVLGKEIELYDLRKFWSTYMTLQGTPGQIIDILQGRTPPKEFEVLMRHYVTIGNQHFILELRKWFDEKAPKVIG